MGNDLSGIEQAEYQARLKRAQALMANAQLDCLMLTTEPEIRYFTGFLTRFWESPTRPWFLIVPVDGNPIAVIPSIGAELMAKTWISNIQTWRSPDLDDDGISLLAAALKDCTAKYGRVGTPTGHETHIRMPMAGFQKLTKILPPVQIVGDADIMRKLRMIKSETEISKITEACAIAGRVFDRVHEFATVDVALDIVFRKFQMACLEEGADWVPYLAGGAGYSGYSDVISPATPTKLCEGDILMLDTGLVRDGYFCDFNRNFAIGKPSSIAVNGHLKLMEAVAAGMDTAKPGATASDLFHSMNNIAGDGSDTGRLGHGLGMQLTEWPSLIPHDHTELKEGMVITLEPVVQTGQGKIMVHEENIVIRANGPELLSPLSGPELVIL